MIACNPTNGQCEPQAVVDGSACNDGLYCTLTDRCNAGTCVGGNSPCSSACLSCNEATQSCDINPGACFIGGSCFSDGARRSTESCDVCDPAHPSLWSAATDGTSCNDGKGCTVEDACTAGKCGGSGKPPATPQTRVECENTPDGRLPGRARPHPRRPVLTWSHVDDSCGAASFEIMLDDSCAELASCTFPSPELDVGSISGSSWSPAADMPLHAGAPVATRYAWRIRAVRNAVSSPWSAPRWVTVGRARNDLNGDGYSDVIATRWKEHLYSMYYYPGGPKGPAKSPAVKMQTPYPGDLNSDTPFARRFSMGDLNGDGFDDLVAEGDAHPGETGRPDEGRFYIYYGSKTGPNATPDSIVYNHAKTIEDFPYGFTVADVNADGFADVVTPTGLPGLSGVMYFYPGSAAGIAAQPAANSYLEAGGDGAALLLGARGDINGDCYEDMAMEERPASFALGGTSGPGSVNLLLSSDDRIERFLASGGDINGDGRSDLVIRARPPGHWDTNLMIFSWPFGSYFSTSYSCDFNGDGKSDQAFNGPGRCPNRRITYADQDPLFASPLAIDGDLNGDGISDLVLLDDHNHKMSVHYGTLAGLEPTSTFSMFDKYSVPNELRYVADTNADGFDDLLVSHGYVENQVQKSGLWVFLGSAQGLSETSNVFLDPVIN